MTRRWGAAIAARFGWVGAFAVAGLALRLALIAVGGGALRFYDERDYDRIARSIVDGAGFAIDGAPTAFRAPGQPLLLAAVYAIVGPRPVVAEVVQALLLLPLPFVVARVAGVLARPQGDVGSRARETLPAILAAAAVAFHPGLTYSAASLYPVTIACVSVTVGLWLVAESIEGGRLSRALGAGALLGVAGAAVTYFAPLAALAGGVAFARRRFAVGVTIAAVGLAPAAAWTARNAATMGAAQLSTNGGFNLALGANDRATPRSGNWIEPDRDRASAPDEEVARDRVYRADASTWIHAHPLRYAGLAVGRALAAFDSVGRPRTEGVHGSGAASLAGWALAPVVGLGILGLWRERRRVLAWLSAAALVLVVASSAATIAKPRFRFPCDPLLWAFAAVAAARLVERARSLRPARADAPVPVGVSRAP